MLDRNEIKKNYKNTPTPMGIYIIKNLKTGKIYIGSSLNIPGKINSNKFQLSSNCHVNSVLQKEYNLYGENNFLIEALDYLKPKDELNYNYNDDLAVLLDLWKEKLTSSGEEVHPII